MTAQVQILANEPLYSVLCLALEHTNASEESDGWQLQPVPFAPEQLKSAAVLVVYAHAGGAVAGPESHGGLRELERCLGRSSFPEEIPVLILGFLKPGEYAELSYLTQAAAKWKSYGRLPWPAAKLRKRVLQLLESNDRNAWHRIKAYAGDEGEYSPRARAAARQLEELSSEIRHAFHEDARPAVRVALGAYCAGTLPFSELERVLEKCARRTGISATPAALYRLPPYRHKPDARPTEPVTVDGTVWLCEDRVIARESWTIVLDAVLAGWHTMRILKRRLKVDSTSSQPRADAVLGLIDSELRRPDGGYSCGGDRIRVLKNGRLDVPLVVFTAYDDAGIARWCLPHGASDFFVKELAARQDRESLRHFQVLQQVLLGQLALSEPVPVRRGKSQHSQSVRGLYLEYLDHRAVLAQALDQQHRLDTKSEVPAGDSIDWHLRQAFRFLLEDTGLAFRVFPRERSRLSSEAIPWTENCLGQPALLHSAYQHTYAAGEAILEVCRMSPKLWNGRTAAIPWAKSSRCLKEKLQKEHKVLAAGKARLTPPYIPRRLSSAFHLQPHREITLADVMSLQRSVFDLLEWAAELILGPGPFPCPRQPTLPLPVPAQAPGITIRQQPVSHAAEAELGAWEYLRHALVSLCPELGDQDLSDDQVRAALEGIRDCIHHRILYIDSRLGDPTEHWEAALVISLSKRGFRVEAQSAETLRQTPDVQLAQQLRAYDCVLMSLHLPGPRDGLTMLHRLKRLVPEVPHVIMTASHASEPVRLALNAGASAYFLKRRGTPLVHRTRYDELVAILDSLRDAHFRGGGIRKAYEAIDAVWRKWERSGRMHRWAPDVPVEPHAPLHHLNAAWSYLWWAEAAGDPSRVRVLWKQWIIDALNATPLPPAGPVDAPPPPDGCTVCALVECGKAIEAMAALAHDLGLWKADRFDGHTLKCKILDELYRESTGQSLPSFSRIWEWRCGAVHGRLPAGDWKLSSLTETIRDTVTLTDWFFWLVGELPG